MCCELYFKHALHSSGRGGGFIKKSPSTCIIPAWETETKSDKEGGFYGSR